MTSTLATVLHRFFTPLLAGRERFTFERFLRNKNTFRAVRGKISAKAKCRPGLQDKSLYPLLPRPLTKRQMPHSPGCRHVAGA